MRSLAWTKGDYTIIPYGILWANLVEEAGRTYPGNYPLYVSRPRENTNDDCYVDARSTRLGFDVLGPRIDCLDGAQSGGKVEIDFQRQIDVENKSSLLLRHAYAEVKNDDFRLLAGQTWDVISPLCPGVLFYSVGWDGGNIGYRRPQFRGERYLALSDTFQLIAQGSAQHVPAVGHGGNGHDVHRAELPIGRSWKAALPCVVGPRGPGCLPWEFGVSGHVGDIRSTTSTNAASTSSHFTQRDRRASAHLVVQHRPPRADHPAGSACRGNCSWARPSARSSAASAKAWTSPRTPTPTASFIMPRATPSSSRGGWVDLWYDWTPRLHSHTGYSIDDPSIRT